MDPRWQKVEEAVCTAVEIPLDDRPSWLDKFCAGDESLRAEIDSLLSAQSEVEDFLEHSVGPYAGTLIEQDPAPAAPAKVGQYRVLNELGRGGMGVVYLAEREDQFHHRVAIKLVKRGLDTEDILRRFRNERQILASLNHPNIAKIFDGGMTDDGLPYFVMEYIEGSSLLRYCDEHELSLNKRLRLFRRVCAAVQHAHQNLIIHRDLKPSNIMVTGEGMVKLLDFGVAKLLSTENGDGAPTQTQAAARVLTPEYASPEQIRGQHVTTSTDVYSLGVVIYELLTGVRPYKLKDTSPAELSRAICETEPTRPSESSGSRGQGATEELKRNSLTTTSQRPKTANLKSLRGDLDNIVLMALRKEPQRRYKSVEQFSEDIRRYLEGLPVIARKDTLSYRSSKFVTRNKGAVGAAVLVTLAIVTGLILAVWQGQNARRQRDLAQQERLKAERINGFLQRMLSFSNQSITSVSPVAQHKNVTVNDMLDQIAPQVETELLDQPEVRAQILRTIGGAYASQGQYDRAERNLRAALEAQLRLYGEDKESAATMVDLGVLSLRQFKLDESARLLRQAIEFYRRQRLLNSPEYNAAQLALALDYLGVGTFFEGDMNTARALMEEALQISSTANLQGYERGVRAFNEGDYGAVLVSLGDIEKGEPLLRQGIAHYSEISSQPHWEQGVTIGYLGIVALRKNQLDDAEKYIRQSEQITRQTLGDKNFYLAGCLNRLAALLLAKNDLKGAERQALESLKMVQESVPNNKLLWAAPMQTLAAILTKQARPREAEDYYRQALAIYEEQPKKNYLFITTLKIRLSEFLATQNRAAEAERYAREANDEAHQKLGEQNAITKTAADNLLKIVGKRAEK